MGLVREKDLAAVQFYKQEDHDCPILFTWTNRFIYLILNFHTMLKAFCINYMFKSDMMVIFKWPIRMGDLTQGYNSNNCVGPQDKGPQDETAYQI